MTQPTMNYSWPYGGPLDHAEGVAEGGDAPTYPASDAESMPLHTGDNADDDAAVLDNMLMAASNPPLPVDQVEVVNPEIVPELPTLMMTETYQVDPAWGVPFLLIPADPHRVSLNITFVSSTATDYVRVSDDNGKVTSDRGSFRVYSANPFTGPHTGPVWAMLPTTVVGLVVVTIASVTKSVKVNR